MICCCSCVFTIILCLICFFASHYQIRGNPDHGVSAYAQCVCGSESQIRGFEVDLKDLWMNLTTNNKLLSPITSSITHGFNLQERLLMSNEGARLTMKPVREEASSTSKAKTLESIEDKAHKDDDESMRQQPDHKTNDQAMQSDEQQDNNEKHIETQAYEQNDLANLESSPNEAPTQDQKQDCKMNELSDDKQKSPSAAEPEVTTTEQHLQPRQNGASNKRNAIMLAIEDIKPEADTEIEITNVQATAASTSEVSMAAKDAADMEQPSAEKPIAHEAELGLDQTHKHGAGQQSVETPIEQKETIAPASTIEDPTNSQPIHNEDDNLQPTEGTQDEVQNASVHAAEPHDTTMGQAADAAISCQVNEEAYKQETQASASAGDETQVESKADAAPASTAATTTEALSEPAQRSNANIPEALSSKPTPEAKAPAKHREKGKKALPGPSLPLDSHPDNVRKYVQIHFKSPVPQAIWFENMFLPLPTIMFDNFT